MKGEIEFFRKRFFGGFNRKDVINYIGKLAQERNENRAALERAEKSAQTMANALDAKSREVDELRNAYDEISNELEELRQTMSKEKDKVHRVKITKQRKHK